MSSIETTHQPDDRYFDVMAEQARTHWWYRARRALARQLLEEHPPARAERLIDVGCGTGDNIGALVEATRCSAVGTDLSLYALQHAPRSSTGSSRVSMAFGEWLPFPDASADVLTCMDVIEHVDDDERVLREFLRVLRPGGVVLLTTSAYMWMWSEHDEWAAHRRRYTAAGLADVTRQAGFEVLRASYYNAALLPPAWLLRRTPLRRLVKGTNDEVGAASPTVDRVFTRLASLERRWLARHRMPFGLSIFLVARRP
jgi:ubiquinone/menaquinone biosynthesis C-methylase UbiE